MPYYPHTIKELRIIIRRRHPDLIPREHDMGLIDLSKLRIYAGTALDITEHILWMQNKIENMEPENAAKAGRWSGWVFAYLEVMGIITNQNSRDMSRIDSRAGNA